MRIFLLSLIALVSFEGSAQFVGLNAGYIYDGNIGTDWRHSRGGYLGLSIENNEVLGLPFTWALRYTGSFTKSKFNTRVDDIAFDLPDSLSHMNNMGFANVDYKKFSIGVDFDFAYQEWEDDVIIPYISLGARFSSNSSWLNYELYAEDSCYCFDTQADEFTTTNVLGLTTGLGIKIQPFERFYIDLRVTYHGGWGLTSYAKNPHLPNTDSFHIDAYGQPTMSFSNKRWAQGMNFSVGLVYGFQSTSGSGWSFSDGDDDDEDYDSEDDYDSDDDGSSGRSCDPIELKPSGRGGG